MLRRVVGAAVVLALCVGIAVADEIQAIITKVEGDKVTFVSDKDQKSWDVMNPEELKAHDGHHVQLSAHVYAIAYRRVMIPSAHRGAPPVPIRHPYTPTYTP